MLVMAAIHVASTLLETLCGRNKLPMTKQTSGSNQRTMKLLPGVEASGSNASDAKEIHTNTLWQKFRAGMGNNNNPSGTTSQVDRERLFAQGPVSHQLYGGRMNEVRRQEVLSSIQKRIEHIKKSNESKPKEADEEDDPLDLVKTIKLFPHQRQGLAWMLWRENQHPGGGILADDMGLGKTLTLISLILKSRELGMDGASGECNKENGDGEKKEGAGWTSKKTISKEFFRSKGTLVVCPAQSDRSLGTRGKETLKTRCSPGSRLSWY